MRGNGRLALSERGFMLLELIAALTILLALAAIALPLARTQIIRRREVELRRDLRQMRTAIDQYKALSDSGVIPVEGDTFGYPPDLKTLAEGVPLKGTANLKYKFLRKIPVDPMTGSDDWGFRSMQDDPGSKGWGGQNVFDVYSKSQGVGLDGTPYGDW
jgi:general secretion pathway protein G